MLKLDLHVHSDASPDSMTGWETILERAEQRGLDGLSITDHDVFDRERFEQARSNTDLILIPGEEVSTKAGHILAYFIDEPITPWQSPGAVVEQIHQQGGLAVAAHPYRHKQFYEGGYFELFDAVEKFNARSGHPLQSGTPNNFSADLVEELGCSFTAGSDAHVPWTIGHGRTLVDASEELSEIKQCLTNGHVETTGRPSGQYNRFLSQVIRQWKEPSFTGWLKLPPRGIQYGWKDLKAALSGETRTHHD